MPTFTYEYRSSFLIILCLGLTLSKLPPGLPAPVGRQRPPCSSPRPSWCDPSAPRTPRAPSSSSSCAGRASSAGPSSTSAVGSSFIIQMCHCDSSVHIDRPSVYMWGTGQSDIPYSLHYIWKHIRVHNTYRRHVDELSLTEKVEYIDMYCRLIKSDCKISARIHWDEWSLTEKSTYTVDM